MSIIDKLATATGNRNEEPNIVLAKEIAASNNAEAVQELVSLFTHKNKQIQSDSIKTLYELAALKPEMVAPYHKEITALLSSKNNRLVWGAMTALDAIASTVPEEIYKRLDEILDVADKRSVITKDHAIGILVKLAGVKKYTNGCIAKLLHILTHSAGNQFAMYSENIAPVIPQQDKTVFMEILQNRIPLLEKESQQKRVQKLLKKLAK
jgi:Vesicle coat complex COPI, gamma subunit